MGINHNVADDFHDQLHSTGAERWVFAGTWFEGTGMTMWVVSLALKGLPTSKMVYPLPPEGTPFDLEGTPFTPKDIPSNCQNPIYRLKFIPK